MVYRSDSCSSIAAGMIAMAGLLPELMKVLMNRHPLQGTPAHSSLPSEAYLIGSGNRESRMFSAESGGLGEPAAPPDTDNALLQPPGDVRKKHGHRSRNANR